MSNIAENRRARFEYHIEEQFEAGLVLACVFFIYRMSTLFRVEALPDAEQPPTARLMKVYGSLFFGAVGKVGIAHPAVRIEGAQRDGPPTQRFRHFVDQRAGALGPFAHGSVGKSDDHEVGKPGGDARLHLHQVAFDALVGGGAGHGVHAPLVPQRRARGQ